MVKGFVFLLGFENTVEIRVVWILDYYYTCYKQILMNYGFP